MQKASCSWGSPMQQTPLSKQKNRTPLCGQLSLLICRAFVFSCTNGICQEIFGKSIEHGPWSIGKGVRGREPARIEVGGKGKKKEIKLGTRQLNLKMNTYHLIRNWLLSLSRLESRSHRNYFWRAQRAAPKGGCGGLLE